ncbi:PEP-CTERM sorting domain-containing protein [Persicirhabdus sediminis]|uniref:PEP-CTERM sorting domain-containing protein n=1 Tax=Persicirhabdus sediminis TaxID=454144 RepID=A0A8J7SFV8_9BACT|nr:PEP-CTERM sorting domain-containing protein [Persicirhabdus sediminis]MBK1789720.1 PEP-CTERM sorting domain-containing protein [Persicirhabdus sediminis]
MGNNDLSSGLDWRALGVTGGATSQTAGYVQDGLEFRLTITATGSPTVGNSSNLKLREQAGNSSTVNVNGGNNNNEIESGEQITFTLSVNSVDGTTLNSIALNSITLKGFGSGEYLTFSEQGGATTANIEGSSGNTFNYANLTPTSGSFNELGLNNVGGDAAAGDNSWTLTLGTLDGEPGTGTRGGQLDLFSIDYTFTTPIPEPSSASLIMIGAFGLLTRRKK